MEKPPTISGIEVFDKSYEKMFEKHRSMIEKIVNKILDQGPEHKNFLGKGETAEVYVFKSIKPIAMKIMSVDTVSSNASQYGITNNLHEETRLAEQAYEIDDENVRVPRQIASFKVNADTKTEISLMEAVDGVTIKDVIMDPDKLPEKFDEKVFLDELRAFVRKMNAKGIHHRDLHEGNIMIDNRTGKPIIIDFGLATDFVIDDPYIHESVRGVTRFTPDDRRISKTFRNLIEAIKENIDN